MKRVLFLASHLCSGSSSLFDSLSDHPRIEGHRTSSTYGSVADLFKLTSMPHKLGDSSSIYMDELLTNHSISSRDLYGHCRYVFLVRPPRATLNEMVSVFGSSWDSALSHYCFRLRRLCTIAKHARGSVFLTTEDLENGLGGDLISEMLLFKSPVEIVDPHFRECEDMVPQKHLLECQAVYDRTLSFMNRVCRSVAGDISCRS